MTIDKFGRHLQTHNLFKNARRKKKKGFIYIGGKAVYIKDKYIMRNTGQEYIEIITEFPLEIIAVRTFPTNLNLRINDVEFSQKKCKGTILQPGDKIRFNSILKDYEFIHLELLLKYS